MGVNGIRLHKWIFDGKTDKDTDLLNELMESTGAVIIGNHTYRTAIDGAREAASPFPVQSFVICHRAPPKSVTGFTYVIDGIESALTKAKAVFECKINRQLAYSYCARSS